MDFKTAVADALFNEKNKKKIIDKWNGDINIPILNEKTEEKIFTSIYETVEAVLKHIILK